MWLAQDAGSWLGPDRRPHRKSFLGYFRAFKVVLMVFPGAQNSVRSLIVVGRFGHGGVARARRGIVDQSRSRGYSRQQNLGRGLQSDFEKPRIPRQRLQISDLDLAPLAAMKTVKTICKKI